ncbi:MAG: aldehyde dehydrogenase family protein, partial [Gemmataceae bacterium]|nr:aldehyde dehydrogenase family protein [Gemmataceae bacterium]
GERLIPSVLELSGCDPMWVFPDANVHLAARAAWFGTMFNRGQTCIAVRRIFVHRAVAEAFRVALHEVLEAAAATGTGQSCPLQTPAQVAQFHRLVRDALARGALLLTPYGQCSARGIDRESPSAESAASTAEPSTCQPTWLWNVPPDAAVLQESCFAPLAAVVIVDSLEQALTLTRQCRFGLAASLFSGDVRQAQQWAAHLPAGQVCVNDVLVPTAHPATPFGGRGASGWGVTQGAEGLLTLTVPQVVTVRRGRWRPHYDEAIKSHPAASQEMLEGLLLMSHAPTWRGRWQGVLRLLRGLRHR